MCPMPDLLRLHADASGDRAAVIVDEAGGGRPSAVTFEELNSSVNRLAHALRSLGMQPGERLVWCGPNSLEVVTTIHAARKAGQIAVPLSYRFNADEMQYVIDNSDATLVVVDAEQAPLVAEIRDRIPKVRAVIAFGGETPAGFEAWDDLLASQPDHEPDDGRGDRRQRRRADALYVGHHRQAEGRGAHDERPGHRRRPARRARASFPAARCTSRRGRSTTRDRWRSRSISHTLGCPVVRAAQVRSGRVAASREGAQRHEHVLGADAAQATGQPATGGARARRPVIDALLDRQRGAGAVRTEAGGGRETRRRLPLRGVRIDRARHRDGAQAGRPAAQTRVVREGLRRDRGEAGQGGRHRRRRRRTGGALHPHRLWRWTGTTAPTSSSPS